MAKRFEFREVKASVDIAGNIFDIDCNSNDTIARLEKFGDDSIDLGKREDDEACVDDSMELMRAFLEDMLGEGAVDKIFASRTVNYIDLFDICEYVINTVSESRAAKLTASAGNRRTHRAGKKRRGHKNEPTYGKSALMLKN